MKYLPLLLFFIVVSTSQGTAKDNNDLIKANYYYSHLAFHEAIPFFEKVAEQVNTPAIYTQLGDCYRLTGSLQKAADAYEKAVKMAGYDPAILLRYGQVLMQLTQYAEADKWLKEYQKRFKKDRRVANLIAGCAFAQNEKKGIPSGVAQLCTFNTDAGEFAPTLWKDKLVFTSDTAIDLKKKTNNWSGKAYYNIYSVTCDNKGNCTGDIDVVADARKLNIKYHNGPATFTADGKQMYYTRTRYNDKFFSRKSITNKDSMVLLEIMIATGYNDKDKEFADIVPFQYNSSDYSVAHPSVSPNGKLLAFISNMPKGAGGSDIYICRKIGGTTWGKPVSAGNIINTEGEEVFPYWADDNTLFFSSDGHEGIGGLDIYKSHWDDKTSTFSAVENIGRPVNSSYDDISLAHFADGRSTYFSSNRPAEKGGDNIFFFKKEKVFVQLNILDSASKQPIAGAKVKFATTGDTRDMVADNKGNAVLQVYPETQYSVSISNDKYEPAQLSVFSTSGKETDTLVRQILLAHIWEPQHDTVPPAPVAEPEIIKHESVMDSPGIQTFVLDKIYEVGHFYFDYNQYQLTGKNKVFLDTIMVQLERHPTMRIELRAHTDCRGSVKSNQILSEKRAQFVVDHLVAHGIAKDRLEVLGLGSSQPLVKCPGGDCKACTEEQHYHNRVHEFRVLKL